MLRKLLLIACLTLLPVLGYSSPTAEARVQFCTGLAQMAGQAAAAKNLGYPLELFNQKIAELGEALADPDVGLTPKEQKEVIQALKDAYAQGGPMASRMQEAFQACVNSKEV